MNKISWTQPILDFILALSKRNEEKLLNILESVGAGGDSALFAALMRSGIFHAGASVKFYRKLRNLWVTNGKNVLKSIKTNISIEILSDGTVNGLLPHLELFLAAYGITADIKVGVYDSVEYEALVSDSKVFDVTLVILSENWLRRYIPDGSASVGQISEAFDVLKSIINGFSERRSGLIYFTSFYIGSWPGVAGLASIKDRLPWNAVLQSINLKMLEQTSDRFVLIDAQTALHGAGGADAVGHLAKIRLHAPFEEAGFIALAREIASALAYPFGRAHRALLTDWDNTIWGGEVGEVGFHGIQCGQESPDGYGYYLLQMYIRELTTLGILVAAVSRNDPEMINVLECNPHLVLRKEHFSSFALSWGDKSKSIETVASELNFGTDLMVYIDDNHVDLAQVLIDHPEIDIILAGPERPDLSLGRLSSGRFFNTSRLTESDLRRGEHAQLLKKQRSAMVGTNKEEFLASLEINLAVTGYSEENRERVLQLLNKTNQFNLTTKRHRQQDVEDLLASNAHIGVFDYSDRFGAQGIIGLMFLKPMTTGKGYEIDTWLMSCRVLNRGVDDSMLKWAESIAAGGGLTGYYIPTEKNSLVRDLYLRMGFEASESDAYCFTKIINN